MIKFKEIVREAIRFGRIDEAGLARMLDRMGDRDFCMLTAWRNENSKNKNRKLQGQVHQLLNKRKMGGYKTIGHWQETPDGIPYDEATEEQKIDVVEDSVLFVRPDDMSREEFIEFCTDIGHKYNQDAIIIGLVGKGTYLYWMHDSEPTRVGSHKPTLGKIGQAYSVMRNKPNVPFIFEGTLAPTNNISRLGFKLKNIEWVKPTEW